MIKGKQLNFFTMLYKYTSKGQPQQWNIVVEDDSFYTEEGLVGGTITTSLPTYCKAKNIGKSNETTPHQQALAEAQAKWQKKVNSGYNEILSAEKKFFEPMLAKDAKESKDLVEPFKCRVFVQQKMDGLRCVNSDNTLMSRNGKPYVTCPHLYQNKAIIDGELFNPQFNDNFNTIVSLCKKTKPTEEDIEEAKEFVQFWAYDFPTHPGTFFDRYVNLGKFLRELGNESIKLVPTFEVFSWKDIKKYHEQFLSEGYEGTIIRLNNAFYENKRSKQLLKYKDFIDEEFKILGAEEGEGGRAGTIGHFIIELEEGKTCKTNIKGDFDYLADVWKNRKKYIGTMATVKYFNRTPDNSLRFPYVIKLNRNSYE